MNWLYSIEDKALYKLHQGMGGTYISITYTKFHATSITNTQYVDLRNNNMSWFYSQETMVY